MPKHIIRTTLKNVKKDTDGIEMVELDGFIRNKYPEDGVVVMVESGGVEYSIYLRQSDLENVNLANNEEIVKAFSWAKKETDE